MVEAAGDYYRGIDGFVGRGELASYDEIVWCVVSAESAQNQIPAIDADRTA